MTHRRHRGDRLGRLLLGLVFLLLTVPTSTAAAAAPGTGCTGVAVLVDFGDLPGRSRLGCAPSVPANGLEVLQAAGFDVSYVPRIPGMVCRIDAQPDPCNGAPATAYWSYWHAVNDRWVYAETGAGTSRPSSAVMEGWSYGAGSPPRNPAPESAASSAPVLRGSPVPPSNGGGSWWGLVAAGCAVLALVAVAAWRLRGQR